MTRLIAVIVFFAYVLTSCSFYRGDKFFEYDEIDYYYYNIDESKVGDLYDNQSKSEMDSFKLGVVLGDIPKSINDSSFIEQLKTIGYNKSVVDKSKFNEIDDLFVEKMSFGIVSSSCIYVYRDVLIFKKKDKVIGVAKVCFECGDHQITGTNAETNDFGQNGDYNRLAKILR